MVEMRSFFVDTLARHEENLGLPNAGIPKPDLAREFYARYPHTEFEHVLESLETEGVITVYHRTVLGTLIFSRAAWEAKPEEQMLFNFHTCEQFR
jgi:hypothetical protein